jgi:hypothetical protein
MFLSTRVHPDGKGYIIPLAGAIADVAAERIGTRPAAASCTSTPRRVLAGIDVLRRDGFLALEGRTVGLVMHNASRARDGVTKLALLQNAPGVKLGALFAPEHGLSSDSEGAVKNSQVDGVPVYSLFGKTRKPTPEMLRGLDTIVFDLAAVGVRFFTYIRRRARGATQPRARDSREAARGRDGGLHARASVRRYGHALVRAVPKPSDTRRCTAVSRHRFAREQPLVGRARHHASVRIRRRTLAGRTRAGCRPLAARLTRRGIRATRDHAAHRPSSRRAVLRRLARADESPRVSSGAHRAVDRFRSTAAGAASSPPQKSARCSPSPMSFARSHKVRRRSIWSACGSSTCNASRRFGAATYATRTVNDARCQI